MYLRFSTGASSPRFRDCLACAVCLALLSACAQPEGAGFEPSPRVAAAPSPDLDETARLREALASAAPAAERLGAGRSALAERAEALRARAADLDAPVLPRERRDRLIGAGATAP